MTVATRQPHRVACERTEKTCLCLCFDFCVQCALWNSCSLCRRLPNINMETERKKERQRERMRGRERGRKTRKREEVGGEERRGDRLMRRNMNKLIRLIHKVRCGTGL